MLTRKPIITNDGSSSLQIPDWNETYHSTHGAIQEAFHVFIKNGLAYHHLKEKLNILEIGLGTGLNCFITFLESQKKKQSIHYCGIEAFPITEQERKLLNYTEQLQEARFQSVFEKIHTSAWNTTISLSKDFLFKKQQIKFHQIEAKAHFDLIYFDAFSPRVQPELWTVAIFKKMYTALNNNGILVTYSAKGSVRRGLQKVGFSVERLDGPPGKREMLRAIKN